MMNALYPGVLDCGILRFDPSRTHNIMKKRKIIFHMSWYKEQLIASTCLEDISLMDLLIVLII